MLSFSESKFIISVHGLSQLPEPEYPEFAFAGRSNVGKSSLMNKLLNRKGFVKVSGRPGKTQGLNFFLVDNNIYLVDLPGYGYAKVSRKMQEKWQKLITSYLEERENLRGVVVIIDIRHEPKEQDGQLLNWLRQNNIEIIPVYTKADKLSTNQRKRNAAILDAGFGIKPDERVIFSSKTGLGVDHLKKIMGSNLSSMPEQGL